MKNYKKYIAISLSALVLTMAIIPTMQISASEIIQTENNSKMDINLSESLVAVATPFISFDKNLNEFVVDKNGLIKNVTNREYEQVLQQVKNANSSIEKSLKSIDDSTNITVATPEGHKTVLYESKSRATGKNAIEFHWNYARVFLTPSGVRYAVGGTFLIAGIVIPSTLVKCAIGLLGLYINDLPKLKNGIWIDANYFMGSLNYVPPFLNCGWQ